MKDKVVRKYNSSSIIPSNDEPIIPSNILISHSQSLCSTSSSFSAATGSISNSSFNQQPSIVSNSSYNQQSSAAAQTELTSSNNNPSFVSSNDSTSFVLPLPIQPTILDDDTPLPLNTTSYVELQPCPFNLTLPPSPPKQTVLVDKEKTKSRRNSMDTCKISLVSRYLHFVIEQS